MRITRNERVAVRKGSELLSLTIKKIKGEYKNESRKKGKAVFS